MANESCVDNRGLTCPDITTANPCNEFQLVNALENCFIESLTEEHLNIGAANLNVYKLLGVHEQSLLQDLTDNGQPISGGFAAKFPPSNSFSACPSPWRSMQTGSDVIATAFIGYDFGYIKNLSGRQRYGIETSIRYNIATIKIMQSSLSNRRVTPIRVERSDDGTTWFGVERVDLPDDNELNTVHFKSSVRSRYWRLRPTQFNGGLNDRWEVLALQLSEYEQTRSDNIQDKVFLENRNRDYAESSIILKGNYDLIDASTELSRFGIEIPAHTFIFNISFNACVSFLGRPIVIGDIIEIPSETQYTVDLRPVLKWLEVTDVAWSTEGYTPGWRPTLLRVTTAPALAREETQDIFGDLSRDTDTIGLVDVDDGNHLMYQDFTAVSHEVENEAKDNLPERGAEVSSTVRQFEKEELDEAGEKLGSTVRNGLLRISQAPNRLYVEDAMPPNDASYTEGDTFPSNPSDGDYHRLTYIGLAKDIPARLYRYSTTKNRWIFLERDRREEYNETKPLLQEFLNSVNRKKPQDVTD